MIALYIWIVSFLSLYVAIFWIIVMGLERTRGKLPKILPSITIAIPAYNEASTIRHALHSLLHLHYPKDKLAICVVNDGSTDTTAHVVRTFIQRHPYVPIQLLNQKNHGKAAALNHALRKAHGRYFIVCDADSTANPESVRNMLRHFTHPKTAAVISAIKLRRVHTTAEKIQRIEYIFSSFVRTLMSALGTLHTTHGVLSMFRTDILRKLGGFDEKNLTEDFEVAMKLRYHGYQIVMCHDGWNYTNVPPTFRALWIQRVRWFRGFIANNLRYKTMLFRKQYGLLGRFQIPLELFTLAIVFFSLGFTTYKLYDYGRALYYRLTILKLDAFSWKLPTFKNIILNTHWDLFFPIAITFLVGLYLYIKAHRYLHEKWRFHLPTFFYFFFYPMIRSFQWVHAFILEIGGARKRWR